MKNHQGYCLLCREYKKLEKSHAIPKTFFKNISDKSTNTHPYHVIPKSLEIHIKGDHYTDRQLCRTCENFLNENYEAYSISLLKMKNKNITISNLGKYLMMTNVDVLILNIFVLSIFWRCYNSNHDIFRKYSIRAELNHALLECVLGLKTPKQIGALIKIKKIEADTFLKEDELDQMIRTPFKSKNHLNLIFGGYTFSLTFGKESFKEKKSKTYNDEIKSSIFITKTTISNYPEIIHYIKKSNFLLRKRGFKPLSFQSHRFWVT